MMGTMGYMPLECMLEAVRTSSNQDVWALGAMTLTICAAPDKVQMNMFAHEVRNIPRMVGDQYWVISQDLD